MPFHLTSGVAPYGRSRSPQVNGPSSRLSSPHCSNKRGLAKGALDLVVWNESTQQVRFIEVKCPHWDCPSAEQRRFLKVAKARGI
jgi:hypothetical protein